MKQTHTHLPFDMYHNTANKLVIINTNNDFSTLVLLGSVCFFKHFSIQRTQNKHTVNKYTPSKTDNTLHIKGKQCGDKQPQTPLYKWLAELDNPFRTW